MNVKVCDVCERKGKLKRASKRITIKSKPYLNMDLCEKCDKEIPRTMPAYEKFVKQLLIDSIKRNSEM